MSEKILPIFFITNDPLRGIGLETVYPDYHIICVDYTAVVDELLAAGHKVFCIEKEMGLNVIARNSRQVLLLPMVSDYILFNSQDEIGLVFFKPLLDVNLVLGKTKLGQSRKIKVFNASTKLAGQLEDKLFFGNLAAKEGWPVAESYQGLLGRLDYNKVSKKLGSPFVVQFAKGWFGNRTFFIKDSSELESLKKNFSPRMVKVARFINAVVLTNNAVVNESDVLQTYPFKQLNDVIGTKVPLTRLPGSTIGNAWVSSENFKVKNYTDVVVQVNNLTEKIGQKIFELGYRGFFGLDFLISRSGEVFVQEMNSRFTASTQMITQMEQAIFGTSLFAAHFAAFDHRLLDHQPEPTPEIFFKPLNGIRVLGRNPTLRPLEAVNLPQNGIYCYDNEKLIYKRPGYNLVELEQNELILFGVSNSRSVNPDQEIFEIQSSTLTEDEAFKVAKKIQSSLISC